MKILDDPFHLINRLRMRDLLRTETPSIRMRQGSLVFLSYSFAFHRISPDFFVVQRSAIADYIGQLVGFEELGLGCKREVGVFGRREASLSDRAVGGECLLDEDLALLRRRRDETLSDFVMMQLWWNSINRMAGDVNRDWTCYLLR